MIDLQASSVFEKNYEAKERVVINRGGSSSSKTYSLALVFILKLFSEHNVTISVVRATLPALKKSVLKDFLDLLNHYELYKFIQFNKTELYIFCPQTNSRIEFFALDGSEGEQKARGARREYLWVNEANEVKYSIFRQLNIRTRRQTFIDFNPSDEYVWINQELEIKRATIKNDVRVIISSYLDNPFLSKDEVEEIELLKPVYSDTGVLISGDDSFWKVFGTGQYGHISGLIFPSVFECEWDNIDLPEAYGQDYGYSNSPTTMVGVKEDDENIYLKEFVYDTGLKARHIASTMTEFGFTDETIITGDSEDPRLIEEINDLGFNISSAEKGPDSVKHGIDSMKQKKIHIDRNSLNGQKEARLYKWKEDRDGNTLNEPVKKFDHFWDAARYGRQGLNQGSHDFFMVG